MASMPTPVPVNRPILTIAGVTISACQGSAVFFFKAGMAIDADGAPTAYHPAAAVVSTTSLMPATRAIGTAS